MEHWKEQWCALLPPNVGEVLKRLDDDAPLLEIRLRRDAPIELVFDRADRIVYGNNAAPMTSGDDLSELCARLQEFSAYAWENERRDGFLTVHGCRVGLSGRMVRTERGVLGFSNVSGVNIRIVREVIDCAKPMLPMLSDGGELLSALLISPPGCGKTTLLRDLVRIASDGRHGIKAKRVGVADERFELCGASDGSIPFDLGARTDVLSGITKSDAALRIVATLSPQVLAMDELNTVADAAAVTEAAGKGVTVLATAHGRSWESARKRPFLRRLFQDRIFDRYVILSGIGTCAEVLDADGRRIDRTV